MSADNWAVCPKCQKVACKKLNNHESNSVQKLHESYGKISQEEYMALRKTLRAKEKELEAACEGPEQTLREDYWMQTAIDGCFEVSYSCHCDKCGFEHKFKHKEELLLDAKKV